MRSNTLRSAVTLAATAALVAGATVLAAGEAAAASGTVITGAGYTLTIRSAPNSSASGVGTLRNGDRVQIECQTEGSAVTGDYGRTTIWDRIPGRGYVSDAWIYTGSNGRVAPECNPKPAPPAPKPAPSAPKPGLVEAPSAPCPTLVVIGARGSGQSPTSGGIRGFGPEVSNATKAAVAKVKASGTVRYVPVSYPAMPVNAGWRRGKYFDSVGAGARNAMSAANTVVQRCPSTKIALVGYSQGASVMRWAIRDLPAASQDRVILVGLIADPERRGFNVNPSEIGLYENYNTGTLYGSGFLGAGPALPARRTNAIVSMCNKSDNVCNNPANTGWSVGDAGAIEGFTQKTHTTFYQMPVAAATAGSTMYIPLTKGGLR